MLIESTDFDGDGQEETDCELEILESKFKYEQMQGSIPFLLKDRTPSCMAVSDRIIGLGTHSGSLHILDHQGNQVMKFFPHMATVTDINLDALGEYVASCSHDGLVVIQSLFTPQKKTFQYDCSMTAVAVDPLYAQTSSRRFAAGGQDSRLLVTSRGWFSHVQTVIDSGDGPILAVKWRGKFLASASLSGVKIFDTVKNRQVGPRIDRPHCTAPDFRPHLVWQADKVLIIGWEMSVKILAFRDKSLTENVKGNASCDSHCSVVASFETDYLISGVAPFSGNLFIMACLRPEDGYVEGKALPEVHVVNWSNEDVACIESIPVKGFERYEAHDYLLAHVGSEWAAMDNPSYYVAYPGGIISANPRAEPPPKRSRDEVLQDYAERQPESLLQFLRGCDDYSLDKAYEICRRKGLLKEQIYLLGRMGNFREALALIINGLEDMRQAVDFVTMNHVDNVEHHEQNDLWDELINLSVANPKMVGALLEQCTSPNLDPLDVLKRVPDGVPILNLKERVLKFLTDSCACCGLWKNSRESVQNECGVLAKIYFEVARRGIYVEESGGTGGRCYVCFEPLLRLNVPIMAFFCKHTYHICCLVGTTSTVKSDGTSEDGIPVASNSLRLKCVVCRKADSEGEMVV